MMNQELTQFGDCLVIAFNSSSLCNLPRGRECCCCRAVFLDPPGFPGSRLITPQCFPKGQAMLLMLKGAPKKHH